ncbi:MAG: acetolactate synthase small subunit [Thermaerobacter sp.]|nr:acetolactate synthase small subunit [Thermaerobacter sp.]
MQRQLGKLVEAVWVYHMAEGISVDRELILIKLRTDTSRRVEVMQIAQTFRATVIDESPSSVVLETTGDSGKVNALVEVR